MTKARSNAVANAAKGDLTAGTGTNLSGILAVGTNGQVLTADSSEATGLKFATPASGGGMTLLSTTTLSGASTTISSIDTTYVNLVVFLSGMVNNTGNGYRTIEPNGSAAISTYQSTFDATGVYSFAQSTIYINDTTYYMLNSNANNAFAFIIYNYASTTAMKPFSILGRYTDSATSANRASWANGGIATTSAITSLVIKQAGGSFTAGTVLIYGVK